MLWPSLLCPKIDNPTSQTWKELLGKSKEDQDSIQVIKKFSSRYESSKKYRSSNQRPEDANGVLGREVQMMLKQLARALTHKWACNQVPHVSSSYTHSNFLPCEDRAGLHLMG
eukprot:14315406-Ditylum_brightwellii.AAC.1